MIGGVILKIIELNEVQFKNYSQIHSKRNYLQTVNYDKFITGGKFKSKYLGLLDDDSNIVAATLLVYECLKNKSKIGYVPGGFLIDLTNYSLVSDFMKYLNIYLKEKGYIYVRVTPCFKHKVYDRNMNILAEYKNKYDNLKSCGANFTVFQNKFSKYECILEVTNGSLSEIYSKFRRNTKREINKASLMDISVSEGSKKDLKEFYELISNRTDKDVDYYKNLLTSFNNIMNKGEIYFAKLDTKNYLNNYIYLEKKEREINDELNRALINNTSKRVLNKKMKSDQRLTSFKNEIVKATNIYKNYPDGIVLSTCLIIKNNREVYFLINGYNEKFSNIYSMSTLYWEVIKKYLSKGYRTFNLGELHDELNDKKSKYFGLYLHKTGIGNKIVEYTSSYDIVINKYLYTIYAGVNSLINSFKFKN